MSDPVKSNGWTLHYTIGDVVTVPVGIGDHIDSPSGSVTLEVVGGTAPARVKDTGKVRVLRREIGGEVDLFPRMIGARWINDETGGHAYD